MTILVYVGPTLDLPTARAILPGAIFLPPAKHADLVSHIYQYSPTHILLVDGVFSQDLPPWHKEFAMAALKGINIYGSSSMGALRASELADCGVMIGAGEIFRWYHEGVIDADDEVAISYHLNPRGEYICDTCPLVNIRAGLLLQLEYGMMNAKEVQDAFEIQRSIHYTHRTVFPEYAFDQKRADAILLLTNFMDLKPETEVRPTLEFVTPLFKGMLERERRVIFNGTPVTLQNIDSYISLHSHHHHQIRWDAQNRALALVLCDIMEVIVTDEEIETEWTTFGVRYHLPDWESLIKWLDANAMSKEDFHVLTIQNARIRKLQGAHVTSSIFSRQTKTILDHLRTHDQLSLWIEDCAECEKRIVDAENDESLSMDLSSNIRVLLNEHMTETGLEIPEDLEEYSRATGIGGLDELRVCLERYALSRNYKR